MKSNIIINILTKFTLEFINDQIIFTLFASWFLIFLVLMYEPKFSFLSIFSNKKFTWKTFFFDIYFFLIHFELPIFIITILLVLTCFNIFVVNDYINLATFVQRISTTNQKNSIRSLIFPKFYFYIVKYSSIFYSTSVFYYINGKNMEKVSNFSLLILSFIFLGGKFSLAGLVILFVFRDKSNTLITVKNYLYFWFISTIASFVILLFSAPLWIVLIKNLFKLIEFCYK